MRAACDACGATLPDCSAGDQTTPPYTGWLSIAPADWSQDEYAPPRLLCPPCGLIAAPQLRRPTPGTA